MKQRNIFVDLNGIFFDNHYVMGYLKVDFY